MFTVGGQDGREDWFGFFIGEGRAGYECLQEGTVAVVVLGITIF